MKLLRFLYLLPIAAFSLSPLDARVINARDFGAIGDGRTDDTAALQAAIDAACSPSTAGQLYIPAGNYLVSKTLIIESSTGLMISGDGSRGFGTGAPPPPPRSDSSTALVWAGPDGGTLLEQHWSGSGVFRDLSLCGSPSPIDKPHTRAGILFRSVSRHGGGNMINKMSNVSFSDAKVGIYMGGDEFLNNDSDVHYNSLTFFFLDTAFLSTHLQAVNYQFDWVFGLGCGTVFHFKEGGNALINNAQLTRCPLAVWIEGGDKNSGAYLINNMRQEGGGETLARYQALRATTKEQAIVHFTNYDDVQWYWFKEFENLPVEKKKPLCEIGPGVTVVFDTSIFSGPLASVTGSEAKPALLTVRDSNFNYIEPNNAVTADKWGFFKLLNNRSGGGTLFPDTIKWPKLVVQEVPANEDHLSQVTLAPPSNVQPALK